MRHWHAYKGEISLIWILWKSVYWCIQYHNTLASLKMGPNFSLPEGWYSVFLIFMSDQIYISDQSERCKLVSTLFCYLQCILYQAGPIHISPKQMRWYYQPVNQVPVSQKRFRSNFKFDKNTFVYIFSHINLITKKFYTFWESTGVLECAKFLCDWISFMWTIDKTNWIEFWIRLNNI